MNQHFTKIRFKFLMDWLFLKQQLIFPTSKITILVLILFLKKATKYIFLLKSLLFLHPPTGRLVQRGHDANHVGARQGNFGELGHFRYLT